MMTDEAKSLARVVSLSAMIGGVIGFAILGIAMTVDAQEAKETEPTIEVIEERKRTVLIMSGEEEDEWNFSLKRISAGLVVNVKLDSKGISKRFVLTQSRGGENVPSERPQAVPMYLDIEGPAVNGGGGLIITLHF